MITGSCDFLNFFPVTALVCESNITNSELHGSYTWPETNTSSIDCEFDATDEAKATRICMDKQYTDGLNLTTLTANVS